MQNEHDDLFILLLFFNPRKPKQTCQYGSTFSKVETEDLNLHKITQEGIIEREEYKIW